ncbi:MAG: RecX family transcriptional regulator [Thermodesulfobacteriota bacterium]
MGMLARRPLSEGEVAFRLARKGHAESDVPPVLARLRELRLLDDAALCRQLVRSWREGRMYGPAKIAGKLSVRLFPRHIIEEALREECPAADVEEAAARALKKKFRGGIPAGREGAAKAYRFLAGRGFPPDACRKAVGRRIAVNEEGDG